MKGYRYTQFGRTTVGFASRAAEGRLFKTSGVCYAQSSRSPIADRRSPISLPTLIAFSLSLSRCRRNPLLLPWMPPLGLPPMPSPRRLPLLLLPPPPRLRSRRLHRRPRRRRWPRPLPLPSPCRKSRRQLAGTRGCGSR